MAATRSALADAFDLRHRLPTVWAGVRDARCEPWVVRKVARMSRRLDVEQVRIVDAAVAAALDEAPSRILAIAEAKVVEADQAAHAERIAANRERRGVWYPAPRPGSQVDDDPQTNTAGIATVFARIDEADDQPPPSMDHWRAEAFAMLADPAAVLTFLGSLDDTDAHKTDADKMDADDPSEHDSPRRPDGASAELVVHLSLGEAGAFGPVARVEGLGPRLLSQVRELLARHTAVTLIPVVDLHAGRCVNGYEHPTDVRHRVELRTLGDVFPHAATLFHRRGRAPDHDHTVPYDRHGPPGQTGDHNDTPLTRHHHRAKTHLGYTVLQLGPDRWVWGTPHGLYRLVTTTGTTTLTQAEYHLLTEHAVELAGQYAA
ncbi:hypothetical protein ACJ5H2_06000 [Nocardioides sp. R1-1]|uniref:hypothetical protein n=1 Tax=Nocardioides sp. R1-1 TaxID=3383502 RepID=UPI0038D02106